MRTLTPEQQRQVRGDDGFALTELLVGAVLALVIIGSAITIFTTGVRSEPRIADRAAELQEARVLAESITREVRQGSIIPAATPTELSLVTYVQRTSCASSTPGPAIGCRVTYICAGGACTRTVANPDGTASGSPRQVVEGLVDSNVFSYSPNATEPSFVGVRFPFPAEAGEDAITISDGVALRNHSPPAAPGA